MVHAHVFDLFSFFFFIFFFIYFTSSSSWSSIHPKAEGVRKWNSIVGFFCIPASNANQTQKRSDERIYWDEKKNWIRQRMHNKLQTLNANKLKKKKKKNKKQNWTQKFPRWMETFYNEMMIIIMLAYAMANDNGNNELELTHFIFRIGCDLRLWVKRAYKWTEGKNISGCGRMS